MLGVEEEMIDAHYKLFCFPNLSLAVSDSGPTLTLLGLQKIVYALKVGQAMAWATGPAPTALTSIW